MACDPDRRLIHGGVKSVDPSLANSKSDAISRGNPLGLLDNLATDADAPVQVPPTAGFSLVARALPSSFKKENHSRAKDHQTVSARI